MNGPEQKGRAPEREALLTRPVALLTLVAFAALFGFQLLLSVVPLYADEAGGGSSGAGLATAAFMLSTVLTQIQMPRILRRFGYRWPSPPVFCSSGSRRSSTGTLTCSRRYWP